LHRALHQANRFGSTLSVAISLAISAGILAAPKAVVVSEENKTPLLQPSYHKFTSNGVRLHLVSFDSRNCGLKVVDQASGPASRWSTAASLGKVKNALACINAGFFKPNGSPLGLVITDGKVRGSINSSSLGSGFFYTNDKQSGIARKSELTTIRNRLSPAHLLQSGPMLSYRGSAIDGLSSSNPRVRSFLATDGSYRWLIGYAESATLDQLGKALTGKRFGDVTIYHAINLDGGRSSDLWVSPSVLNGNKTFRALWNKPVRNFLLLTKK
jgi:hypothetical protein